MKLEKLIEEAHDEAIRETFDELEDGTKEQMRFLTFIAGFSKSVDEVFKEKDRNLFRSGALSMLISLKKTGFLKDYFENIDLDSILKLEESDVVYKRTN